MINNIGKSRKININFMEFDENESHKFVIPILANDTIRTNLQRYTTNLKIPTESLVQYLENQDEETYKTYNNWKKVLFHSESLTIEDNREYLPESYFVSSRNYEILNFYLEKVLNNDGPDLKFIIGARGIGKTLTMNILLREKFNDLCGKKRLFVRCDAKKYLLLKQQQHPLNNFFCISDYIDIQFLYIFCEKLHLNFYKKLCDTFKEIDLRFLCRESKTTFEMKPSDTAENMRKGIRSLSVAGQLEYLRNVVLDQKRNLKLPHYGRDVVIARRIKSVNAETRTYDNWIALSQKIQNYLFENGYRILKIVDGIDNVDKYDYNGNKNGDFESLLNDLLSFERVERDKSFLWFFMRSNTFQVYSTLPRIKFESNPNKIYDSKIEFQMIPKQKFEIAKKRKIIIEKLLLKNLTDKNLIDLSFMNEIDGPILKLIDKSKHIEDFLYNWISFIFSKKTFHKNRSHEFIKGFYVDNLLLNGKFFLNSQERPITNRENGSILFNIFHYNIEIHSESSVWHGWCTTRIIQFIQHRVSVDEKSIVDELSEIFHYDRDQIKYNIRALLTYGFIRYKEIESKKSELILVLTESGNYLINSFFSTLDILYHCSLDTPLPQYLMPDKISSHINDTDSIRHFAKNCLNTATTFINYLYFQHNKEIEELTRHHKHSYIEIFSNPFDFKENYDLLNERIKYYGKILDEVPN